MTDDGLLREQMARDAAIAALLPRVAEEGWSMVALRRAAGSEAEIWFPGGAGDLLLAHSDLADRRMAHDAGVMEGLRLPEKVRRLIAARLEGNRADKPAIRRALATAALPPYAPWGARALARTVDAIWHAAGDRSADFSWYTKRATLAGIFSATMLRWLTDGSADDGPTLAFLDRRLEGVARFGRLKRRCQDRFRSAA